MDNIKIVDSKPEEVFDIQKVIRETWIDTYPNNHIGISRADIIERFKSDETEEGRKRIELHKSRYSNPDYHTWVAKKGNKIIGMCIAGREKSNHRIYAIYILPKYQHQGIGKGFIEKALKWIGKDGKIYVNVASYNQKAIEFYENFGFTKSNREVKETARPFPNGVRIPEIELVKANKPMQYLLVGFPYSGKTTLAKELEKRLGFARINIDELKFKRGYEKVGDDEVPDKVWDEIFNEADELIAKYLKEGKNLANEYAWITKEWRDRARKAAKDAGFETRIIYLDIPIEEIKKRWKANEKTKERFHWPENEFKNYLNDFEKLTDDEDFISYSQTDSIENWIKNNL